MTECSNQLLKQQATSGGEKEEGGWMKREMLIMSEESVDCKEGCDVMRNTIWPEQC
jgi:hypothetical protein